MGRTRRLAGFPYRGRYRYLLTFCARPHEQPFISKDLVTQLVADIQVSGADTSFDLIAHCFMTDHVHLVIEGLNDASELGAFVSLAKQRCEHTARRRNIYPLWRRGYHDRILRQAEPTSIVVRYVLDNPRRACLKPHRHDYPFCGAKSG